MRLPAVFAITALASFSPALTLSFDSNLSVQKAATGNSLLLVTGTIDYVTSPIVQPIGVGIPALSASGPGAGFTAANADVNAAMIGKFSAGHFQGLLFTLSVDPAVPEGIYDGTAQMKLFFAKSSSNGMSSAPLHFEVKVAPVPEPLGATFVAMGFAVAFRRRR